MNIRNNNLRNALFSFINGYKEANKFIRREKRVRLAQLRTQDSLNEYDDLCRLWETTPKGEDISWLEKRRILFLIRRRELFNKVARYRKNQ